MGGNLFAQHLHLIFRNADKIHSVCLQKGTKDSKKQLVLNTNGFADFAMFGWIQYTKQKCFTAALIVMAVVLTQSKFDLVI